MRRTLLGAAACLTIMAGPALGEAGPAFWQAESAVEDPGPAYGVGTSFTFGSSDYRRFSAYADGQADLETFDPYGWLEYSIDDFIRQLGFGGGVWKDLSETARVKGGLGLNLGTLRATDERATSWTFETGAERGLGRAVGGGEYRLTSGSILPPSAGAAQGGRAASRAERRRASAAAAEPFHYHELAGYLGLPAGPTRLGLRLAYGSPSAGEDTLSETVSWRVPAAERLWVTTAATLEQSDRTGLYLTLGLHYDF